MIISSIGRVLNGTKITDAVAKKIMEKQVKRIQDRLNKGIDLYGRPFSPYKHKRSKNRIRPLLYAARLFEPVEIDSVSTGAGRKIRVSIYGRAARIAKWQNNLRKFYGYSPDDRKAVVNEVLDEIRVAGKRP